MKTVKRGVIFLVFIIMLNVSSVYAALGIRPAKIEMNFQPGFKQDFKYTVDGNPGTEIEVYSAGELSEHVTLNKKKLIGSGTFIATVKLPAKIEKPGKHTIIVGAKEVPKAIEGGIGVAIAVQAIINVYVPFPGKYAEITFEANDANVGEPINFLVEVSSLGKENITANVYIEIYSRGKQEEKVETIHIDNRLVESQAKEKFYYSLNTSNYKAGDYKAVAIVEYEGEIAKAEKNFRIGSLFVEIVNWTEKFVTGKINKFNIGIESRWNNKLDNVYADIIVIDTINVSNNITSFRTPSIELDKWASGTLIGYFDTSDIESGSYKANIVLFYKEASNSKTVDINIIDIKKRIIIFISIALLIVIVIIIFLVVGKRKNKKKILIIEKKERKY